MPWQNERLNCERSSMKQEEELKQPWERRDERPAAGHENQGRASHVSILSNFLKEWFHLGVSIPSILQADLTSEPSSKSNPLPRVPEPFLPVSSEIRCCDM